MAIAVLFAVELAIAGQFQLLPFYLALIAFSAWFGSPQFGAATVVVGLIACLWPGGQTGAGWTVYWNVAMQATLCLATFTLTRGARAAQRKFEERVRQQSQSLEAEVADRKAAEQQQQKSLQQFRQFADNISDGLWMRNAGELRMGYVSPAYERIWGRSSKELYQTPEAWSDAIHIEDRHRVLAALATKPVTGEFNEEYRVVRPDGSICWIRDRSFPIRNNLGEVIRVVGIAEDITDRRRLEREILEISDREQGRIGQDLHDSLCQKLVTLAFDLGRLDNELLAHSVPEARSVRQMSSLVDDLISEARATARGLFPVQLESDGLYHALQELAANVISRQRIECRVIYLQPVNVRDNGVAIQLYRIAQEAVTNATKHSRAKTIEITLNASPERVELRIVDDGVGFSTAFGRAHGLGLHIMEYRARAIGGTLYFGCGAFQGVTIVCSAPQTLA